MKESYMDRWMANVSAWVAMGALLGGIVKCLFPASLASFEVVSTLGGASGALLGAMKLYLGRGQFRTKKRPDGSNRPLVLSYLGLRRAVGIIGVALPFALAVGKSALQGGGIESSLSAYYYTDVGGVYAGSFCAIAVLIFQCRGFDRNDEISGRLAGILSVSVALFPSFPRTHVGGFNVTQLHWMCVALLFLDLALMCLLLFTKTDPDNPTPKKRLRNKFYVSCGWTILACVALIGVVPQLRYFHPSLAAKLECLKPIFWLESGSVLAFAIAWLVKGETFSFIRD